MKISNFLFRALVIGLLFMPSYSCNQTPNNNSKNDSQEKTAADILGNPDYLAISYGGYRETTREAQPTIRQLKEDMRILYAMGIRILRTYNVQLPHAANVLEAIRLLKKEDPSFEMYVMLGAWINCENAWTDKPNHDKEDEKGNSHEIHKAIRLANKYSDIVKIIAVGNEAMVKWAASYYVQPGVILKWVNHLQEFKQKDKLPKDLWITSSDNFASWGGGGSEYHVEDLDNLIKAVDYISLHTYPMHDTHYNGDFWGNLPEEENLSTEGRIEVAMIRAREHAMAQYESAAAYIKSLGVDKPIHIGETGWASYSNGFYGDDGTKATDEYKGGRYYSLMRDWTNEKGISCFYFEAFDEIWKDAANPGGAENHFGLFTIEGQARYALWDLVDNNVFDGLRRGDNLIVKTHNGDKEALLKEIKMPPVKSNLTVGE